MWIPVLSAAGENAKPLPKFEKLLPSEKPSPASQSEGDELSRLCSGGAETIGDSELF